MCRSSADGGRRCTGSARHNTAYNTARKRAYRARQRYDAAQQTGDPAAIASARARAMDAYSDLYALQDHLTNQGQDTNTPDTTPPAPTDRPTVVGAYLDGDNHDTIVTNFGTLHTDTPSSPPGRDTGGARFVNYGTITGPDGTTTAPAHPRVPTDLGARIAASVTRAIDQAIGDATVVGNRVTGPNHGTVVTIHPDSTGEHHPGTTR